jgi:hypothetical protein
LDEASAYAVAAGQLNDRARAPSVIGATLEFEDGRSGLVLVIDRDKIANGETV